MQDVDFLKSNMKYSSRLCTVLLEVLRLVHCFRENITIGRKRGKCVVIYMNLVTFTKRIKMKNSIFFFYQNRDIKNKCLLFPNRMKFCKIYTRSRVELESPSLLHSQCRVKFCYGSKAGNVHGCCLWMLSCWGHSKSV